MKTYLIRDIDEMEWSTFKFVTQGIPKAKIFRAFIRYINEDGFKIIYDKTFRNPSDDDIKIIKGWEEKW